MTTPPFSPLTREHLEAIRNGLDALTVAEQQIALAKQAGLDVTAFEQQLRDNRDKLLRLKNTYFPGA